MRLLFDQNLSPKLVDRLSDVFPGSAHVRSFHCERAPDTIVWEMARDGGYTIVTKDGDFSDRSAVHGFPPKVVWFKRGNCSTAAVAAILRNRRGEVAHFGNSCEAG